MKKYYLKVAGAAATPFSHSYELTQEGDRWVTAVIDLYDNDCYINYSATKSSYGLPLNETTWIGLNSATPLTAEDIQDLSHDFDTDSGMVRDGRFIDTSGPADITGLHIASGVEDGDTFIPHNAELAIQSADDPAAVADVPESGPFNISNNIQLSADRYLRVLFYFPDNILPADFEAYISVEIDKPIMAPLYRSTRKMANQYPEWMAIHNVPEESDTLEVATPNTVGASLINALTGEWVDDIQKQLRWEDFQRFINTVDLSQMAWAYETEELPEFIFSVTGDGKELTRSYDFNEFLDSEGEDVVYIDHEEGVLYTAKVYIDLDINGVEYLQVPYHVWNYLDEIGLYVDLERIFLEDNETYQKRIKDVFANRGGVGVESLKLALRRELNIWAAEGATPDSDYVGATPEILEIEDLEKDPKYWSEDGMPTQAFVELVNDLSYKFPTTWGRFVWDEALWDTAGEDYKGHGLIPYRMDGEMPPDVQSGVGDGDDLFVFRPDVITGPRDFQATLKLRGRERTPVEEYVPLHIEYSLKGVGDKIIYDNPENTTWLTVEIVDSVGDRYFHAFKLSATSDIDNDTPSSTADSHSQYIIFDESVGTTLAEAEWVDINNNPISSPISISSIAEIYLRTGRWVPDGTTATKQVSGGTEYTAWFSDDETDTVGPSDEIATGPAADYVSIWMESTETSSSPGTWESEEFSDTIIVHGVEPYDEPVPYHLGVPEIIWDDYATNRQIQLQLETLNPFDAESSERGGIAYDDEGETIFVPAEVIYVNDGNDWDSEGIKYFAEGTETLTFDTGLVAWGSGAGVAATPQPANAPMLMSLREWGSKQALWVSAHADNRVDVDGDVNLLDADTAHLHQSIGDWVAGTGSVSRSTTYALYGDGSLQLTNNTGAISDIDAHTPSGTSGVPVSAGQEYTAMSWFREGGTTRSVRAELHWYDSAGTFLSQSNGTNVDEAGSAFTQATVTATAPTGAEYAAVSVVVLSVADTESHYVDQICLRTGSSLSFVPSTRIVGDFDIRYRIAPKVWDDHRALGKYRVGGEHGWLTQVINNKPSLVWSTDGSTDITATATAEPTVEDRKPLAFRSTLDLDNGVGAYEVEHFTATDDDLSVATWTQLGSTITGGTTTSVFQADETITVGQVIGSTSYLWDGGFLSLEVRDGKDGPVVLDVDFSQWVEGQATSTVNSGHTATLVTSGTDTARIIHINSAMVTDELEYFELEADETLDQDTAVIYVDSVGVSDPTPWQIADWTHDAPDPDAYTWVAIFAESLSTVQDAEITSWDGSVADEPSWLRRDAVFYWNADDSDAVAQYALYNDIVNLANYAYPISTFTWSPFEALHDTPYNGVVDENGPWRNGVPPSPGNSNYTLATFDQLTRDDFGVDNTDEIVITWIGVDDDNPRVITWLDSNTVKPSQNDEESYPESAVDETVVNGAYTYEPVVLRARIKPGPDKQWSPQVHSGYFYDEEEEYYLYAKEGQTTTSQQEVVLSEVVRQGAPVIVHTDDATPEYLRQVAFFDEDSATPSLSLANTEIVDGTGTSRLYVSWSDIFAVTVVDEDGEIVNVVSTTDNVITTDITTDKDETYAVTYKVRDSFIVDNDHIENGEPRSKVYFAEAPASSYVVHYETSDFDPATPVDLALNPLYTSMNEGFVFLSHDEYDLDSIRARISPSKILADNEDYLMLTVDSLDEYGNPKPYQEFQLDATGGVFDKDSITTGTDGTAIAILTSAEHPMHYAEAYWEADDGIRGGWLRDLANEHDGAFGGNAKAYILPPKGPTDGYLRLPGSPNHYVEIDSNSAVDGITNDIDFRIGLAPDRWSSGSAQTFVSKWDGNLSWKFGLNADGHLTFTHNADSNLVKTYDPVTFADGTKTYIRVSRSVDGAVKFFFGPTIIGPWEQIGPNRHSSSGTINTSTDNVEIGSHSGGVEDPFAGRIYQVQLIHGADTVFDVNFSNKPEGSSTFQSTSIGNVSMDCAVHAPDADTSSYPRLIKHDGEDFLYLTGMPDNYAYAPDTNILDADTAHIEQGIGDWVVAAGSTAVTQDSSLSLFGNYSLKPTLDNNDPAIASISEGSIEVSPSTEYSFSVWVYTNASNRESEIRFSEYAGATPSAGATTNGPWTALTAGEWTQVSYTHTMAADTTNLRITVAYRNTDTTAPPSGENVWLDKAILRTGSDATFIPSTNLVGDAEVVMDMALDNWAPHPGEEPYVVGKTDSWAVAVTGDGSLTWVMGTDELMGGSGSGGPLGTSLLGADMLGAGGGSTGEFPVGGVREKIKTHRETETGTFYVYQFDGETWNEIGTGATTAGDLAVTNGTLEIGSDEDGTLRNFQGKIFSIEVRDGVDGPIVASLDPELSEEPHESFVSDEGHQISIARAAGGYKSVLAEQSTLLFDGVNDYIEVSDHDALDFDSNEDLTALVVFRIYDPVSGSSQVFLAKKSALDNSPGWAIYTNSSDTTARIMFNSTSNQHNPTDPISPGILTTLGFSRDVGTDVATTHNGVYELHGADDKDFTNDVNLHIGSQGNDSNYLSAELVSAAVINGVLTEKELAQAFEFMSGDVMSGLITISGNVSAEIPFELEEPIEPKPHMYATVRSERIVADGVSQNVIFGRVESSDYESIAGATVEWKKARSIYELFNGFEVDSGSVTTNEEGSFVVGPITVAEQEEAGYWFLSMETSVGENTIGEVVFWYEYPEATQGVENVSGLPQQPVQMKRSPDSFPSIQTGVPWVYEYDEKKSKKKKQFKVNYNLPDWYQLPKIGYYDRWWGGNS